MFFIFFSIISENMFLYQALCQIAQTKNRATNRGLGRMAQLRFPVGCLLCDPGLRAALLIKPGEQGISGGGPYRAIYYRAQ
jgi:hypothetical protein